MIHYLPLEHLEGRYTTHLDRSITAHLHSEGIPHVRYYPAFGQESAPPPPGFFLNARGTIGFKARQLADLAVALKDGDTVFCSDLWFPGIESVAYLAYFGRMNVKLRGLLHAGSFTDTDYVRDLERWAAQFENMVFDLCDKIYVGSEFMRCDVLKKRLVHPDRVVATGFPLDPALPYGNVRAANARAKLVLFTGRLCDEKQPHLFDELSAKVAMHGYSAQWVKTQAEQLSKPAYYDLLCRASCVVSFALQENFGFSILEAAALGCVPVVPDRLVYPELFDSAYRYRTMDECVRKVEAALAGELEAPKVSDYSSAVTWWFDGL